MKKSTFLLSAAACAVLVGGLAGQPARATGTDDKIDAAQLKAMIEGLGYETKALNAEVGKEKYEFKVNKGGFDIPIAAELSGSTNYIWLTVFLGSSQPTLKFEELLKQNFNIQPSQFYITTKGNLMMAIAIDNRQVNAAVLRRNVDKLSEDTSNTHELWSGK